MKVLLVTRPAEPVIADFCIAPISTKEGVIVAGGFSARTRRSSSSSHFSRSKSWRMFVLDVGVTCLKVGLKNYTKRLKF